MDFRICALVVLVLIGAVLSAGCASSSNAPAVGLQPRHGDEVVVAGHYYRIGTPVVLWTDPGGYDAYRVERRFAPWEEASWEATARAMEAGKIEFVSSNQQFVPNRFGLRYARTATATYSPEQLEQVRGGGWDLPLLQQKVDQFVIHYDVCPTSEICFKVLHDMRGLSVHFLLDVDGTIYQTLDLKERAWHAGIANDRSIGIEIANMGSYATNQTPAQLLRYYKADENGQIRLTLPENLKKNLKNPNASLTPVRNELIVGEVQGSTRRQYDFTAEQYAALIKLTAALGDIFPQIKLDYPRDEAGNLLTVVLTPEQFVSYKGVLGHLHVTNQKQDPGPAFQWDYVLDNARKLLDQRRGRTGVPALTEPQAAVQ
jgi:N-acetyl-anhydromuramyl-L-alanine amidase AmpD